MTQTKIPPLLAPIGISCISRTFRCPEIRLVQRPCVTCTQGLMFNSSYLKSYGYISWFFYSPKRHLLITALWLQKQKAVLVCRELKLEPGRELRLSVPPSAPGKVPAWAFTAGKFPVLVTSWFTASADLRLSFRLILHNAPLWVDR